MRVNLKVRTNVSKIETTGFGREDGGCLGALFLKVRTIFRTKNRFKVPWIDGLAMKHTIPNLLMLLFWLR